FGHDVLLTSSRGEEAVPAMAKIELQKIDVALVDYELGYGLNGLQTAKEILRRSPATQIIIMTANDSIKNEVLSAGFGFLQKPFEINTLVKSIEG
ncbi:MAG: response regulator, partial [Rhabdochlamydiaceae bacterium]